MLVDLQDLFTTDIIFVAMQFVLLNGIRVFVKRGLKHSFQKYLKQILIIYPIIILSGSKLSYTKCNVCTSIDHFAF